MKTTIVMAAVLVLVSLSGVWLIADNKPSSLADARAAVEANLRTPEGKAYDQQLGKEFIEKYMGAMKQCKQAAGDDLGSFWILMNLDKDGAVKDVLLNPTTKMGTCARETLLKAKFSPPPRPAYWAGVYMKMAH